MRWGQPRLPPSAVSGGRERLLSSHRCRRGCPLGSRGRNSPCGRCHRGSPGGQNRRNGQSLPLRECADLLVLRHAQRHEQPPAAGPPPALLAHQQITDRHAVSLPGAAHDDIRCREVAGSNLPLHAGSREPNSVGVLERSQMLLFSADRGRLAHQTSPQLWCVLADAVPRRPNRRARASGKTAHVSQSNPTARRALSSLVAPASPRPKST
jgi:hypothetical protein